MENVELIDIYKILLNMQSDIHGLDKKTDAIQQELRQTTQELRAEIKQTRADLHKEIEQTKIDLTNSFDAKLEQTKIDLTNSFDAKIDKSTKDMKLELKKGLTINLEKTAEFVREDIFPYLDPTHEKRILSLEEFAMTKGYNKVCDSESTYDGE